MPGSWTDLQISTQEERKRRAVRIRLTDWAALVLSSSGRSPAAHHLLMLAELDAVASGQTERLMVFMPPGSAKSTYASVIFPAWWFTRHPASSVIIASHTAGLAEHFSRQVRGLVAEYGPPLGTDLVSNDRAARRWRLSTGGQYFATGLRGPLAGRRADLIVIDDPVKSQAEADSAIARDAAWNWYRFDLITRLTPGGRVVLVMTRWHEDDLGGRLLAQNGPTWRILRLPALAGSNDALGRPLDAPLWPEWQDAAALLHRRETIGERAWSALYQQLPRPLEGSLFKVDRIAVLETAPDSSLPRPVRAWDLAATPKADGNDPDWTVGLKLLRQPSGRFVVLDVVRRRGTPWQVEQMLLQTAHRDGPDVLVALPQDPGSAGKVAAGSYVSLLAGFQVSVSPESGPKIARATPVAAQLEAGNLAIVRAHWNAAFIEELRDFPLGRKDDQVDALSHAFARLTPMGARTRRLAMNFVTR